MSGSTEADLRDEICRVGASLFARGYVHATAGNISVRTEDGGMLITPTDACLGTLDPARLARLDAGGHQLAGDAASKTRFLHCAIYDADAAAGCVIHTHATHAVALSLLDGQREEFIPPITPYFVMKVGHVPLIPYHRPGDPEVSKRVAERIRAMREAGRPIRAVMLARLGPNVWHETPAAASAVLEELEETCRLFLQTRAAPLSEAQIEDLRTTFKASW